MEHTFIHRRLGIAIRRGFSAILLLTQAIGYLQCTPASDFSESTSIRSTTGKSGVEVSIEVSIVKSSTTDFEIRRIDAFVFNTDDGRLDCCQSFECPENKLDISSSSGDKTIYLIANTPARDYRWSEIGTLYNFRRMILKLENDSLEQPTMVGSTNINSSDKGKCSIQLKPASARICLNSLTCDFSGTAYEGQKFKNLRVYLNNVNADTRIDSHLNDAFRFINVGALREDDVKGFTSPEIICRSLGVDVDSKGIKPKIEFLCYSNPTIEESLATPFTKLVIEGSIDGETWYYPINIAGGAPINGGTSYIYDIVLKRKGCTDPDTIISITDIGMKFKIVQWKEKSEYVAEF